jgi:ribosomal protein L7/L12
MSDSDSARIQALELKVAELQRNLAWLMKQLDMHYSEATSVPAAIAEHLKRGNLIEAIKAYREYTGAGLAEAKQAVESIEAKLKSGAA